MDHYAGRPGPHLSLPRGEYRLVLGDGEPEATLPPGDPDPAAEGPPPAEAPHRPVRWVWLLVAGFALLNLAAWLLWARSSHQGDTPPAAETRFWQAIRNGKPTVLVAGDYYLFGETGPSGDPSRLIRDFSINSREGLDQYLLAHRAEADRLVDLDMRYLPVGVLGAALELLPLTGADQGAKGGLPPLVATSHVSPDMLKANNLVYVGFFSGLGLLSDPVMRASGFAISADKNELIDRASGRRYSADWQRDRDRIRPTRDFAYLASLPGPTGGRILIVIGTRDAALMQAAEIAANPTDLDRITRHVGNAAAFEALIEVRTLHNLNLGSHLLIARPLPTTSIWTPG